MQTENFSSIAGEVDQNVTEWSVRTAKPNQEYPNKCRFGRISSK